MTPINRGNVHHFDEELAVLKDKLITMGGLAEAAVRRSLKALLERDDANARHAREQDELLDQLEVEIDELAIALLAKAPLASDLRLVTVAMKISRDLERVGDEATTIARRALELNVLPPVNRSAEIVQMSDLALAMLKDALDTFVRGNPAAARSIIPRDREVDRLNKQVHRDLTALMVAQPETITRALALMIVSKALERIADHAKNVAEEVVYLYEGHDIRHQPPNGPAHP